MNFSIPKEIINVTKKLEENGFEAFLVGGCVRDLILGREPKDWDVTTNSKPEEIISIFPDTFYENTFGTVGVKNEEAEDSRLKVVEITPYRLEGAYSDGRHPDSVIFSHKIEDDLKRRDFTVNAMAYSVSKDEIVDLYGGQDDLKDKVVRAVGNPIARFSEDGLRVMRAIRFSCELNFEIESETEKGILEQGELLTNISRERIRDELEKIVMSQNPMRGFLTMKKLGVLKYVIPELEESIGIEQGGIHAYDVWEHSLRALQHAADKEYPLEVRLAALFHDIAKPATRRGGGKNKQWTFFGHEVIGAKMTKKILDNLRFPTKIIEKVVKLVRWHMFFSDTEQITLSAVRRMIVNVGGESDIWDLMNLRICDRIGAGRPKEDPYRLRKYHSMIEEALRDPISVQMLKINGKKIMEITKIQPGPKIGQALNALLEEVLDDPSMNNPEYLEKRAQELIKLPDEELRSLGEKGRESKDEAESKEIQKIRKEHKVQ